MRALLVALVAVAVASLFAASAGATFPGRAGLIAAEGEPNGDQVPQIVLISAVGGDGRVVGYGSGPRWSPDGTRLAFGTIRGLEVASTDGRGLLNRRVVVPWRKLVDKAGTIFEWIQWEPAWSPRGRMLAYVVDPTGNVHGDIHVVRAADGKARRRLTYSRANEYAGGPAWSPDGRTIAYYECIRYAGMTTYKTCNLLLMDADGGNKRVLVRPGARLGAMDPVWSPDGGRLAYDVCGEQRCTPWILDLRTRRRVRAPGLSLEAWSPGGTRFVYFDGRAAGNCDHTLVVAHVDGSHAHALPGCFDHADWQPLP